MVARGVGRELAASVAAHRDILYRIQHPCGMIIPCFSPVVNTFFCGFGVSRNFRDIVTKTTGYSGVVWLKGRPGRHRSRGTYHALAGGRGGLPGWLPAGLAAAVPSGGGVPSLSPAAPAFGLLSCPHPPDPLPLRGRGRLKVYFAGGFAPGTPALNRLRHLQTLPSRHRRGDLFSASPVRCKTDRTAFLWAVPAAKERGDRGRGTSAFEMVLSPGAGRTSAAGVQPPPAGDS